jgi:hypothetical protein
MEFSFCSVLLLVAYLATFRSRQYRLLRILNFLGLVKMRFIRAYRWREGSKSITSQGRCER